MGCTKCSEITLFKGEDGNTILNGSGAPGAGLGNIGDFYIDTTNDEIYGPKTASGWGSGTSILGANGAQGNYGGWSSEWLYDGTATTSGTSAGDFRFDNGTMASVTGLFINDTNTDSANMQAFLDAWNNSGAFGLVRISKKSDANVFWMGIVTAEVDSGSEHDVTVTYVIHNGTFTDNDACVISFVESGADGTDGADASDLYDSDWVSIGAHNGTFGLPAISNWTNPKLRVIGHHCYISGNMLVPLATAGTPTVLLNDYSNYPSTQRIHVQVYTGSAGGYSISASGSITSIDSLIPSDLQPVETVTLTRFQIAIRSVRGTGGNNNLNLITVFPAVNFDTAGKLVITTMKDLLGSAGGVGTNVDNTPLSELIMNVTAGEKVIDYSGAKQQYNDAAVEVYPVELGSGYNGAATYTGVTTTTQSGSGTGLTLDVTTLAAGVVVKTVINAAGSGYVDGEIVQLDDASGTPSIGTGTTKCYVRVETDERDGSVVNASTYPATFDGKNENHLGGFVIPFTISYPINSALTEAQIQAAIASM
jgi:hypothetical protein